MLEAGAAGLVGGLGIAIVVYLIYFFFMGAGKAITKVSDKYKDVPVAEKLAIFGENDLLQIAINQGKANKLLGLKLHEIIRIEFK